MEKSSRISFGGILNNNKALLVISCILAFIVWFSITVNQAPEIDRVIEDVKVTIDSSVPGQLGYETFGIDDVYVDLVVHGKRYLVGENVLDADDFTVTAVTSHVDAPGVYSLQLKATANDANASYTIVSKTKDNIEVYFDTPKTKEFSVETNVESVAENLVAQGDYLTESPRLSVEKITVSGPATEVDKIQKVVATARSRGNLKSSETLPAVLTIADAYGAEIKYLTVSPSVEDISITVPVYTVVELPVTVDFENLPVYYTSFGMPEVICDPETVRVAVDSKNLESLESIKIGTVNFAELEKGDNEIMMDLSEITDAKPIDPDQKVKVIIRLD